jgi:hypothetical protein
MTRALVVVLVALTSSACATAPSGRARPPAASGGEGRSCERAIALDADRESAGAAAQAAWLDQHFPGAKAQGRTIITCAGRQTELVTLETALGDKVRIYFDVSKYYGKF